MVSEEKRRWVEPRWLNRVKRETNLLHGGDRSHGHRGAGTMLTQTVIDAMNAH